MDMQSAIVIEIDPLILRGMDLTPECNELIRSLEEQALQQLLPHSVDGKTFDGEEISIISTPMIHLTELDDDYKLANELAQSIVCSLGGGSSME